MPTQSLFATSIYHSALVGGRTARALNDAITKEAPKIEQFDLAGKRWSGRHYPNGYTSYGSLSELFQLSSTFARLRVLLDAQVRKFARELGFDARTGRPEMSNCWLNVNRRGALHTSHLHPHSVLSGSYYVKVPAKSGNIKFEDPRAGLFMNRPSTRDPQGAYHSITPRAGDIILFESWLRHEVEPNFSDEPRLSVSFNYRWDR